MQSEGLRAEVGYGSKPRYRGGPVGVVANVLNRDLAPDAPNRALGNGYHLYPDLRGLAVSGGSHGSVFPSSVR